MLQRLKKITDPLAFWPWLLIFLAPITLYFINPEWVYPDHFELDAYFTLRYAHFYDVLDLSRESYKAERAPFNLFLNGITKVIGGESLMTFLAIFYYIGLVALYYKIVHIIYGQRSSILSLPFILFYPHIVSFLNGGVSLHISFSVLFFLLALFLYDLALKEENKKSLYLLLTGVSLATAFFCNLVLLNLLLCFFAIELCLTRKLTPKNYFIISVGILTSFLFWNGMNYLITGELSGFSGRLNLILKHGDSSHFYNDWYQPLTSVFFLLSYVYQYIGIHLVLLIPFAVLMHKERQRQSTTYILAANFIFSVLFWFFLHTIGFQSLFPAKWSYVLQVPLFLALPLLLKDHLKISTNQTLIKVIFAASGLFLILTAFSNPLDLLPSGQEEQKVVSLILILIFAALITLSSLKLKQKKWASSIPIFLLPLLWASVADPAKTIKTSFCPLNKESYLFFNKVLNHLKRLEEEPQKIAVFHFPQVDHFFRTGACKDKQWIYGSVMSSLNSALSNDLYQLPLNTIYYARKAQEVTGGDFFHHLNEKRMPLVVFELDFPQLKTIEKKAKEGGYTLREKRDFSVSFFKKIYRFIIFDIVKKETKT